MQEMKKIINKKKCSCCGKMLDTLDMQEDFTFDKYIGYGSKHDEEHIKFQLCCNCFDKIFDVIKPLIKDIEIEDYEEKGEIAMGQENLINLSDALQLGSKKSVRKKWDKKLKKAQKKFGNSEYMSIKSVENSENAPIKIENEKRNKEFYQAQIVEFCNLCEISISKIQRYLEIGFSKATRLLDNWKDKKYIIQNENKYWQVLDKNKIFNNLQEVFKEKL